jgi:hypothetical protein
LVLAEITNNRRWQFSLLLAVAVSVADTQVTDAGVQESQKALPLALIPGEPV